jgi:hypothetical protein
MAPPICSSLLSRIMRGFRVDCGMGIGGLCQLGDSKDTAKHEGFPICLHDGYGLSGEHQNYIVGMVCLGVNPPILQLPHPHRPPRPRSTLVLEVWAYQSCKRWVRSEVSSHIANSFCRFLLGYSVRY